MLVSTSSNGTFSFDCIKRLVASGINRLEISINGFDENSFSRNTGMPQSLFQRILSNAKALIKHKKKSSSSMQVIFTCVFDQSNFREAPEFVRLAQDSGADRVAIQQFLPAPIPGFSASERCLFFKDEEIREFFLHFPWFNFKIPIDFPQFISEPIKVCESPCTTLRVDGNGNVGGCVIMLLNNKNNGHFLDQDVWNNDYFQKMRALFLNNGFPQDCCRFCTRTSGVHLF